MKWPGINVFVFIRVVSAGRKKKKKTLRHALKKQFIVILITCNIFISLPQDPSLIHPVCEKIDIDFIIWL
jgi:hypothetical protein